MATRKVDNQRSPLYSESNGVLGLPTRMVVALIVGAAALGTLTYCMMNHCWLPKELNVNWEPKMIKAGHTSVTVTVTDADGDPVPGASVTITGLGGAGENKTDKNGTAEITIHARLPEHRNEGYLDVTAQTSGCYKDYSQKDAIKVVAG